MRVAAEWRRAEEVRASRHCLLRTLPGNAPRRSVDPGVDATKTSPARWRRLQVGVAASLTLHLPGGVLCSVPRDWQAGRDGSPESGPRLPNALTAFLIETVELAVKQTSSLNPLSTTCYGVTSEVLSVEERHIETRMIEETLVNLCVSHGTPTLAFGPPAANRRVLAEILKITDGLFGDPRHDGAVTGGIRCSRYQEAR